MAELAFAGVGKTFPLRVAGRMETVRALDQVSFTVRDHEIVALCGPSGCGKTTALRIAMGLEPCTEGQVTVDGKPIAAAATTAASSSSTPSCCPGSPPCRTSCSASR